MGYVIINCEEYKMNLLKKSRLESEDRRRGRMQVTPNREVKKSYLALCGKCSSKHSIKEPCYTKGVDRSMRCLACGGTTRDHLIGCKGVKGLRELGHSCRKPGHTSRNCPKCNYCGEYGHETENCTKKKEQCQKCGSDGHQTEFCRRHKRFTDMYAEIRKQDPIPSIDDSICSPEYDTEEIKQQFEKLKEDRERLRSLTPLRGEQERPEYKPRVLAEKKINLKVSRDRWTPYRDESIYPIAEEGEAQDGSETERKRANPLPRKTSHLERRRELQEDQEVHQMVPTVENLEMRTPVKTGDHIKEEDLQEIILEEQQELVVHLEEVEMETEMDQRDLTAVGQTQKMQPTEEEVKEEDQDLGDILDIQDKWSLWDQEDLWDHQDQQDPRDQQE